MEGVLRQDSPESKGTETFAILKPSGNDPARGRIPPNRRGLKRDDLAQSNFNRVGAAGFPRIEGD